MISEQLKLTEQQHQEALDDWSRQHDEQLTALKKQLEHERRVTEVETQREVEIAELKKVRDQHTMEVSRVQQETSKQLDQLKARNTALETELNTLRKIHSADTRNEHNAELARLETEKSHVEKQLKASEDERRKLEMEKSSLMKDSKEVAESLERKVGLLETQLEEAGKRCRELVSREHDSLQREHALVVAALQEKLTEKNHVKLISSGQVQLLSTVVLL